MLKHQVNRFFEAQGPSTWDIVCCYVEAQPLADGQEPLSMRAMDYFVRMYIQQHPCTTVTPDGATHNLKAEFDQVKAARHKDHLDPFRRSQLEHITFHGRTLATTYAQLAFFMWCIQSGALDFVHDNRDEILSDKRESDSQLRRARVLRRQDHQPPTTANSAPAIAYATGVRAVRI
jgi:hypothetical protein